MNILKRIGCQSAYQKQVHNIACGKQDAYGAEMSPQRGIQIYNVCLKHTGGIKGEKILLLFFCVYGKKHLLDSVSAPGAAASADTRFEQNIVLGRHDNIAM